MTPKLSSQSNDSTSGALKADTPTQANAPTKLMRAAMRTLCLLWKTRWSNRGSGAAGRVSTPAL